MLVGVLSDTHGYFHPELTDVLSGCNLILHAGDVGRIDVLDALKQIAPVRAVFGNVDGQEIRKVAPREERLSLEGLRVWMTHIGGRPGRWDPRVRDALTAEPPDLFICGHSHILRIERVKALNNMIYLNPGAAGREGLHRVKTCVRLDVADAAVRGAEVVHLDE